MKLKYDLPILLKELEACSNLAITKNGSFSLIISGGRTPLEICQNLNLIHSDFKKWFVVLSDERLGKENDFKSNEREIYPYFSSLGANVLSLTDQKSVIEKMNIDLAILGAGEDGHVASLFPLNLENDLANNHKIYEIHNSPKEPPKRITLSYDFLLHSRTIWLLILGQGKKHLLDELQNTSLPFVHLLKNKNIKLYSDCWN